jgi:hypothetical protein
MGKGILEFVLPEEEEEFNLAVHATSWALVSLAMDNWLRNEIKNNSTARTRTSVETLNECREKLREVLRITRSASDNAVTLESIS